MSDVDGLAVLGLGPAERECYELLMAAPATPLADLATAWARPEPLEKILAALEERSLVVSVPGPPVSYRAVAPGVAFDGLLADFEEQLEHARRHVSTLDAAYQARPTTRDTSTVVEVVTGQRAVRQRMLQIRRGARQWTGFLVKPPRFVDAEADRDPPARGVVCRMIYDRSSIEHPGALSTVENLIRSGQSVRVLPDLPVSLYLADDRIAVLPLQRQAHAATVSESEAAAPAGPRSSAGARNERRAAHEGSRRHQRPSWSEPETSDAIVVVHPSALLDALIKLFDGLWQRAMPLHAPPASSSAETQRLITLLLSGLTDEAIAHQLGLSHRTVQRRVANLMTELGAHTRFQAGVQAALNRSRYD